MLMYGPTHPKRPPHRKDVRAQINLMKEVSHCGTVKVGLECVGETSTVDRQGPFCSFLILT